MITCRTLLRSKKSICPTLTFLSNSSKFTRELAALKEILMLHKTFVMKIRIFSKQLCNNLLVYLEREKISYFPNVNENGTVRIASHILYCLVWTYTFMVRESQFWYLHKLRMRSAIILNQYHLAQYYGTAKKNVWKVTMI